jgi:hypothetical protein
VCFSLFPGKILACYFTGARPNCLWLSPFCPWPSLAPSRLQSDVPANSRWTTQARAKMTLLASASSHFLQLIPQHASADRLHFLELFPKVLTGAKSLVSIQIRRSASAGPSSSSHSVQAYRLVRETASLLWNGLFDLTPITACWVLQDFLHRWKNCAF